MSDILENGIRSNINACILPSESTSYTTFSNDTMLDKDFHYTSDTEHRQVFNRRQVNLESHQLVWLDPDFNRDSTISIKNLRNIIDYTRVFDNGEDCLKYIEKTQDTTTFLVCSKELAQRFIPEIHQLQHVLRIYVESTSENQQPWFSNYPKVIEVKKDATHLLDNLSTDVYKYLKHRTFLSFDGFSKIEKTTDNYGGNWWYGFIRLLITLPYSKDSCHKLVEFLRFYYEGNIKQLRVLSEFQANYKSNEAILWYTRPTIVFGLLNKALRQHNIEVMFLFGFFVQDFYQQLKTEFENFKSTHLEHHTIVKSYRGQVMHVDEIKQLKVGRYITNNSFLSTSLDRHLASLFLNSLLKPDDQFQNVLFEFEIDDRQEISNLFANISSLSCFPEESELLFMIGCKFEVQDIAFNEAENYWLVKMDLDYAYRSQEYRFNESTTHANLRGALKLCSSELTNCSTHVPVEDINTLFNELAGLFPSVEKWIRAIKLFCLGLRKYETSRNNSEPISYYKQALDMWNNYIDDDEYNRLLNIGEIHKIIAVCFEARYPRDKNSAMTHCDLAIRYMKSADEKAHTDYEKIDVMNRLANTYSCKMHISNNIKENAPMVMKYLELVIQKMLKYYTKNDIMIISRMERLAKLFVLVDKYDDALTNYKTVLEMYRQQTKPPLDWIERVCESMASIYVKHKHNYDSGLHYQLIRHEYTLKSQAMYRTDDINDINSKKHQIALSYEKLSVIYIKLCQYNLAYTNLSLAMKLYEEILESADLFGTVHRIAETKVALADIAMNLHQYGLASEHLHSVMRLCEGRPKFYDEKSKVADMDIKLSNHYAELQENNMADQHLTRALNTYRAINDSQYSCRVRVRTVSNGRVQRQKRSLTIIYLKKCNRIRSNLVVFLDSKIKNISHRVIYNEIRFICNRHR
ncbi:unnamed protein product [Rotaria magnacalcarata]|uniref:ADP ribosyltransferase domain-containing protein n=2 Tax=Rotaria magnacalcarata TaxID=392030 RepID=A0A819FIY3_9BILA|nr:unnamed protein product [Rotaria magnacalcarata]